MESIVESVRSLAASADQAARKELLDTLYDLVQSIEGPVDSLLRLQHQRTDISVLRVGYDLHLFHCLVEHQSATVTPDYVAEKTGAESALVARLLRYLASIGAVQEKGQEEYAANARTRILADPAWQAVVHYFFDVGIPSAMAIPSFLAKTDYRDVVDGTKCPFNKQFATDLTFFQWLSQHPEHSSNFNNFMSVLRFSLSTWLDRYPFKDKIQHLGPDQALFVDIGGGFGHQSVAFRQVLPDEVTHRIIVQDEAHVIAEAASVLGVETMAHDFWEPQTVRGARLYYLRHVLHDWHDDKALTILQNTRRAMAADSLLLIDELILPNTGAKRQATQLDMSIMALAGSRERTQAQWEALIDAAGLVINAVYQHDQTLGLSVIECKVASNVLGDLR